MGNEVVSCDHSHEDDLHLYVLGRLAATEMEMVERHVFRCPACADRLASIARMIAQFNRAPAPRGGFDKRKEPRFSASDTGFVRSFAPLLPGRWPVRILDVSKNGFGLAVPRSLALGSLVQVQVGNTVALGEVRHSTPIGEQGFRVGIRVIDTVGKK